MSVDIRQKAEERVNRIEIEKRNSYRISSVKYAKEEVKSNLYIASNTDSMEIKDFSTVNKTPEVAKLAEIDYKWNGFRARLNSGDFIVPRWIPDEEIDRCMRCSCEFDWINRKHHCRNCGKVICENCSPQKLLLPDEYGLRDPQRVCLTCSDILKPQQFYLTNNIANHQRINTIDIASENCNVRRYFNLPFSSTLGSEIRKAAYTTHNFLTMSYIKDKAIPLRLLAGAYGLAFLTIVKGGFMFAPRFGTGLVIARLSNGEWTAPTAIATFGVSWGAVIGVDFTDYVIILNTPEAVSAFAGYGQVSIGAGIDVAIGPVGRSASADVHLTTESMAPAFSYSHSRGLYAGISLDGCVIVARNEVNHKFYGRLLTPMDILSGQVEPPRAAAPLYDALRDVIAETPDLHYCKPPVVNRLLPTNATRGEDASSVIPHQNGGMEEFDKHRNSDSGLK